MYFDLRGDEPKIIQDIKGYIPVEREDIWGWLCYFQRELELYLYNKNRVNNKIVKIKITKCHDYGLYEDLVGKEFNVFKSFVYENMYAIIDKGEYCMEYLLKDDCVVLET